MTASEGALWGLWQVGRRLELYVEDFIERIELILFHPALRTYTYLTNGSDRLPNSKRPIILRSSNSVLSPESPSAAHSSKPFAGKYRPPSAVKSGPSFEVLFRPAIRREIQGRQPWLTQGHRSRGKQARKPPGNPGSRQRLTKSPVCGSRKPAVVRSPRLPAAASGHPCAPLSTGGI